VEAKIALVSLQVDIAKFTLAKSANIAGLAASMYERALCPRTQGKPRLRVQNAREIHRLPVGIGECRLELPCRHFAEAADCFGYANVSVWHSDAKVALLATHLTVNRCELMRHIAATKLALCRSYDHLAFKPLAKDFALLFQVKMRLEIQPKMLGGAKITGES
jgi:hypothetical protein